MKLIYTKTNIHTFYKDIKNRYQGNYIYNGDYWNSYGYFKNDIMDGELIRFYKKND